MFWKRFHSTSTETNAESYPGSERWTTRESCFCPACWWMKGGKNRLQLISSKWDLWNLLLTKTKLAAPSVLYVLIEHKLCLEKKLKLWTWKKMRPATEKSVFIKDKCRNQSQEHKHGARWKHHQCFFNLKRTNSGQEHQHQCCWKEKPKLSTFTSSKVMNITIPAKQWRSAIRDVKNRNWCHEEQYSMFCSKIKAKWLQKPKVDQWHHILEKSWGKLEQRAVTDEERPRWSLNMSRIFDWLSHTTWLKSNQCSGWNICWTKVMMPHWRFNGSNQRRSVNFHPTFNSPVCEKRGGILISSGFHF